MLPALPMLLAALASGGADIAAPRRPGAELAPLVITECFPGVWLGPRPADAVDAAPRFLSRRSSHGSAPEYPSYPQPRSDVDRPTAALGEWGGTVPLVLDDLGDLGAPGRVLAALRQGRMVDLEDVRRDELINYYSYTRAPAAEGETFALRGDARLTDPTTLSVALALSATAPTRRPLDLTLVVERYATGLWDTTVEPMKARLKAAAARLRPGDRVDLVVSETTACTALDGYVVGRDDPTLLERAIDAIGPQGRPGPPDLGVREGLRVARGHAGADPPGLARERRVLLTSFAYRGVDPVVLDELAAAWEADRIRVTAFDRESYPDRARLAALTARSHTTLFAQPSPELLDRLFAGGFDRIARAAADDVRVTLSLPPGLGLRPVRGEPADAAPRMDLLDGQARLYPLDLRFQGPALDPAAALRVDVAWTDPATGAPGAWSSRSTVGELVANGSADVDKARVLDALAEMLVTEGLSEGFCKARRRDLDERVARVADPEIVGLMATVAERCRAWPQASRDYVDEVDRSIGAATMTLCAAPRDRAFGVGRSRLEPPAFVAPYLGCAAGVDGAWGPRP
jgi:hypothetical protein